MPVIERCDVLMDDGTWQPGGRVVRREGERALVAFQELTWWAAPDEWRLPDLMLALEASLRDA